MYTIWPEECARKHSDLNYIVQQKYFGKHEARQLRAGGWVPGRVQTRTGDVLGVKLKYEDIKQVAFDRFLKNTIYTVVLAGQDPIKCLVREMQVHVRTCVCLCVFVCVSMCVCVCVESACMRACVCVCASERERER